MTHSLGNCQQFIHRNFQAKNYVELPRRFLEEVISITSVFIYKMGLVNSSQEEYLSVHHAQPLVSCIQPGLVICFTIDNMHVLMLFSRNIPPLPSPTESKSLFCTSVSLFVLHIGLSLPSFQISYICEGSGRERWEGGLGWGIHVNPWLIHVNV